MLNKHKQQLDSIDQKLHDINEQLHYLPKKVNEKRLDQLANLVLASIFFSLVAGAAGAFGIYLLLF